MRRRILILAGGATFLVVSFALAVMLTGESQRGIYLDVLRAQATGDVSAVLDELERCEAPCVAAVKIAIAQTRGTGEVKLVRVDERPGVARVVWVRGAEGVPVVQCLRTEEDGSPFGSRSVRVLRVESPLKDNQDTC